MQLFTPRQYLQIDIASSFGLDKSTWNARLDWFEQNQHKLHELISKAATPALFYAGVTAWEDVVADKAIGYPISLDGTASGMQLLSVLTGDRSAAELCNVVSKLDDGGSVERADAYTKVYDSMLSAIGETGKISRDDCKQAVLTSLYGSTAIPKEVFGTGKLLNVFLDTMGTLAPAAWELNQAFLSLWDNEALVYSWVMPDNFHVHIKVMVTATETVHFLNEPVDVAFKVNAPKSDGRSLSANTVHSLDGFIVREITRRCDYDPEMLHEVRRVIFTCFTQPNEIEDTDDARMVQTLWELYEKSGYLSARILQHLNQETIHLVDRSVVLGLVESMPAKPFKVLSIHDAFRVHPLYGNDIRTQYNLQLYLIAKSKMLGYLLSQIVGKDIVIGKLDPTLADDILDTDYALS